MTIIKNLSISTRRHVLHECGYQCSNPICRTIITLDVHHLDYVSEGGKDEPDNLLALCPNCHALHHKGEIPIDSLRAWKMLQLALNEAFDKKSINLLLTISKIGRIDVSGEGVLECAALIASDLLKSKILVSAQGNMARGGPSKSIYQIQLTEKGNLFIESWKNGDQKRAIEL